MKSGLMILRFLGVFTLIVLTQWHNIPSADAAINEQLTFYGSLQNSSGVNLNGTYDMVFRFYDAPTGGTLLDTSTHTAANGNPVLVTNAEFSAQLGSGAGNALDGLDFDTATIYVGLTVNADSEMSPRERLAAAPYAFNADKVDGYDANQLLRYNATGSITASDPSELLTITQNGLGDIFNVFDAATEVFSIIDGGNVGVGTSTPIHRLSVDGNAIITGALYDNANSAGTNGMILQTTGSGFAWVATSTLGISGGGGSSLFTDAGVTTYLTALGDSLAIGTTSANAKLTVAGNINIDNPSSGLSFMGTRYLYASSTNDSLSFGEFAGATLSSATDYNIFIGFEAGRYASASGVDYNTALGYQAGQNNTNGSNILLGYQAGQNNTGWGNVILGYDAGVNNADAENILIGNYAGQNNTGFYSIAIGGQAGENNTAYGLNAIGYLAGQGNTGTANNIIGGIAGALNTGDYNSMIGEQAGYANTGDYNLMFGGNAGVGNTGSNNILMGEATGYENKGSYNNSIGRRSGVWNDGDFNNMIGYQAGAYLKSTSSTIVGAQAFRGVGGVNVEFGAINQYTALNNTALGYRAGYIAATGANNNILIGYQAADNLTTAANNIIIGYDVDIASPTGTGQLNIGNLIFGTGLDGTGTTVSSGNIGIGTTTPQSELAVIGDIRVGNSGTNGCIEGFDGSTLTGVCSSDERLKTNIVDLATISDSVLENLVALTPVTYSWNQLAHDELQKTTGTNVTGLIAQDVEKSFPELVTIGEGGFRQVRFSDLPFYIIQAMKEMWVVLTRVDSEVQVMQETITTLENELSRNSSRVGRLLERIETLESELDVMSDPTSGVPVETPSTDNLTEEVIEEVVLKEAVEVVEEPVSKLSDEEPVAAEEVVAGTVNEENSNDVPTDT